MKRLSKKEKARLIRRQKRVLRIWAKLNRAIELQKRKEQRKHKKNTRSKYIPASRYYVPKVVTIDHPDHRSELLTFLSQLRSHYKDKPSVTLVLDFSNTSQFVSSGTLLLYAELNRLIAFDNSVKLRCTEPANDRASQVLKQIGIYKLCSNHSTVKPTSDDVVHWQVVQGKLVDNSLCAPTIEGFQNQIDADTIDELLGGLGEAMTNAIHHAYDDIRPDGLSHKGTSDWWMFSQAKNGHLSVVFCDLGIGIPTTLPLKRPNIWQKLLQRVAIPTDGDCIREAIIEGRTRTGLHGRGYGLGNIVDVVENIPDGTVIIYSNKGRYDSRKDSPYPNDYTDSILGTLITWHVPMNSLSKNRSGL
ncbi:MAG TPA: hypothetical protein VFP33_09935 [Gallionella sp.]|nr:hypothetical protein [Gallionella sp.]